MEGYTARFADRLYRLSQQELPEKISEHARYCFLDYLAVVLAGSRTPEAAKFGFAQNAAFSGACHVFGQRETVDLRTAAMRNAFSAHVLELDDSHRVAMTHLGAPIFSALLASAELRDSSLDELLHAAVTGYEAAIRLAVAIQPGHKKRGFHVSGTCCTVGSAMAIADLLKLDKDEFENTLSAAATSAAGLLGVISGRSEQKPYNVANAACGGVNAAFFGHSLHAPEDILCNDRGFFRAMTDRVHPERLTEDGGYAIEGIYQKLYAACRHCHAPMEAMLRLRAQQDFVPEHVEQVRVDTYDLALTGHDHTDIRSVSSAKQSIPYGVAVACLTGDCGVSAFTQERVTDARLLDLTARVQVAEDPALSALVPQQRAAVVTVRLRGGEERSCRVDYPKGEPENPISRAELLEKFRSLAAASGLAEDSCMAVAAFALHGGGKPVRHLFERIQYAE